MNLGKSAEQIARREKLFSIVTRASGWLDALGLSWLTPLIRMAIGDNPREQLAELRRVLLVPLLGIVLFLFAWGFLAPQVNTSLGVIPGPAQVWTQAVNLWKDHLREREKAAAFYERQEKRNEKLIAAGKADKI
ncbi:MAG: ABC transporter permease, partial [Alphaproteobacteria bacterium]